MLESIKMILGLEDTDKYDKLIQNYITDITNQVLEFCNRTKLTKGLESIIKEKVCAILSDRIKDAASINDSNKSIKSLSRGDTKIEYNTASTYDINTNLSSAAILTDVDRKTLSPYCVVGVY